MPPSQRGGLSPRVRGNPAGGRHAAPVRGSIPAGAGKPHLGRALSRASRVYPRGCGETLSLAWGDNLYMGLSPRVRGNRRMGTGPGTLAGSIPAGAGKPRAGEAALRPRTVYPRGCGETCLPARMSWHSSGLSPRVRGNLSAGASDRGQDGSIPAGAGKPEPVAEERLGARVYPRGCGETHDASSAGLKIQGLSPRVRGNHGAPGAAPDRRGSIPAGAGKPSPRALSAALARVYPRGCGETRQGHPSGG